SVCAIVILRTGPADGSHYLKVRSRWRCVVGQTHAIVELRQDGLIVRIRSTPASGSGIITSVADQPEKNRSEVVTCPRHQGMRQGSDLNGTPSEQLELGGYRRQWQRVLHLDPEVVRIRARSRERRGSLGWQLVIRYEVAYLDRFAV